MTTPRPDSRAGKPIWGPPRASTRWCSTWCPYSDADGNTLAVLNNRAGNAGVAVGYNTRQLPVLTLWKNTDTRAQGYVTGIEPGTSYAYSTKYQRPLGLVPKIQPGRPRPSI